MAIHQVFCSVSDILADLDKIGGDEARLYQAIREASNILQERIGWFIPVTQTTKLRGNGQKYFYPYPPVLALTGSITNDVIALTLDSDFVWMRAMWPNGPYMGIELLTDAPNAKAWCDRDANSVVIPCRAGLYERTVDTSADVNDATQQTDSQATLKVTNGAKVSPGMVLLIGSEQELVTGWDSPIDSTRTLNGAITSLTADEITLSSVAGLNVGEIIRVDFEQMRIKAINSTTNKLSVDRSWNGTRAVTHLTAAVVEVYRTVTVERAINGTTAAAHLQNADIYRYMVPDNIFKMVKKMAVLGIQQSNSNYSGRSGDAQQGTVTYYDLYPRFELEELERQYWIGRA